MTAIERAARVLAKDQYPEQPSTWHDAAWREYVPTVQAVLQAIREPVEGEDRVVVIQRRVMIDHILAEGA